MLLDLTVHTDAQGLLSGLSLLFKNLASADDTVLIFPYHDSLPMCLFILVIVSKGQRLGKILSENIVRVDMSLARAYPVKDSGTISIEDGKGDNLVELVLLKWMLGQFL